jgi:hypothetical protein
MAGDNGSRRFVKFWWVLAFIVGVPVGAVSVITCGLPDTIWGIVGFGLPIAGMVAALEWFGGRRRKTSPVRSQWRRLPRVEAPQSRKTAKARPTQRRGQLHAITGRKTAEPPSSAPS